jgi:flagellar protein FlaF
MKHTITLQVRPEPAKLDVLININRELAAGLRSSLSSE